MPRRWAAAEWCATEQTTGRPQEAATAATTETERCVTAQTVGGDKDEESTATAAATAAKAKERMAGHAAGAA
eukprot:COSAG01_NODE_60848_length_292_cov_1.082902_1_plen_71_part_10